MKSYKISIIIPVWNEATTIASLLHALLERVAYTHHEIILVDGGSTDKTANVIQKFISGYEQSFINKDRCIDILFDNNKPKLSLKLLQSKKGRARQMNYGASKATGDILYFLHADTFPPIHFDKYIMQKVSEGFQAGCFRMRFKSFHPVLLVSEFFTRFNVSWCRGGDQSLFVRKSVFEQLGGYDESFVIYEDCEFIERLYKEDEFTVIPKSVVTSARKYKEKGTWKLQYHFAMIHYKRSKGASPEELYAYYKKYVAS